MLAAPQPTESTKYFIGEMFALVQKFATEQRVAKLLALPRAIEECSAALYRVWQSDNVSDLLME
jgi:hypothetical protein